MNCTLLYTKLKGAFAMILKVGAMHLRTRN